MIAVEDTALAKTIEDQRQALFRACAVIGVCANACINEHTDPDEMAEALRAARQMVDGVATELEVRQPVSARRSSGRRHER